MTDSTVHTLIQHNERLAFCSKEIKTYVLCIKLTFGRTCCRIFEIIISGNSCFAVGTNVLYYYRHVAFTYGGAIGINGTVDRFVAGAGGEA